MCEELKLLSFFLPKEKLRAIKKKPGAARTQCPCKWPMLRLTLLRLAWGQEKDSKHGMDVWNEGQRYKSLRKDWDAVKALTLIASLLLLGGDHVPG